MMPVFLAAAKGTPPPYWFIAALFVVMWCGISLVSSRVSGWSILAEHYRSDQPFAGTMFRMQGAQFRYGFNYNGCLNFGVGIQGLRIAPIFILRLGHPALLIPWTEITAHSIKLWWFFDFVELRCHRAPVVPLRIPLRLAAKLAASSVGQLQYTAPAPAENF